MVKVLALLVADLTGNVLLLSAVEVELVFTVFFDELHDDSSKKKKITAGKNLIIYLF